MTLGIDTDELAFGYVERRRNEPAATFTEFVLENSDVRHERFRRLIRADAIAGVAPDPGELLAGVPELGTDSCASCFTRLTGGTTPVVVFHWSSGNAEFVGRHLPGGADGLGFWYTTDPAVAGTHRPATDLRRLAAHYVAHLEEAGIARPLLVGMCSGGQLAFEVAHQLRDRGGDTLGLLAVNTPCPGVRQFPAGWDVEDIYRYRLASLSLTLAVAGAEPVVTQAARFLERLDSLDPAWSRTGFHWQQLLWATNFAASEAYRAEPLDVPLRIFHGGGPGKETYLPLWARLGPAAEVVTAAKDSKSILAGEAFRSAVDDILQGTPR